MKTAGYYLKEHWRGIVGYFGAAAIILIVGLLYEVRMEAMSYAVFLSMIWLILWGSANFVRYVRRSREREEMLKNISFLRPGAQSADTLAEEQYQKMLSVLWDQKMEKESDASSARQESVDYYSLWAHQIKTPLAAMRLLLQEEGQEHGSDSFLKEMDKELFRTEQYVEMVMTYVRIGDISKDLVLQWYSLDKLIKQAVRKYSRLFILQKLKLNYQESDRIVLTDEKWLSFILEQLLSNALKYTKEGEISIRVSEGKEHELTLMIQDTGIGIYAEDLPRVFERGFTGYTGREHKKSTGIGLYLCKQVADKLGHSIWIESEPGVGTTVFLGLGRVPVQAE